MQQKKKVYNEDASIRNVLTLKERKVITANLRVGSICEQSTLQSLVFFRSYRMWEERVIRHLESVRCELSMSLKQLFRDLDYFQNSVERHIENVTWFALEWMQTQIEQFREQKTDLHLENSEEPRKTHANPPTKKALGEK